MNGFRSCNNFSIPFVVNTMAGMFGYWGEQMNAVLLFSFVKTLDAV